jgi:hypothetical protein
VFAAELYWLLSVVGLLVLVALLDWLFSARD